MAHSLKQGIGFIDRDNPYFDDISAIHRLDPEIATKCGYIVRLKLPEGYDCKKYLNAVRFLARGSANNGKVAIGDKLSRLLNPEYAKHIPDFFESSVFLNWLYVNDLPPWSWTERGGKAMLHALKTGARKIDYDNELELAGELGMEDTAGGLASFFGGGYPVCYIDLGSGDGGKGVERSRHALKAGRKVVYVAVDNSKYAVDTSVSHAKNVFSRIADEPEFEVIGVHDRIEHLPLNEEFQAILGQHPQPVFMLLGGVAANYYPHQSTRILKSVMPHGGYAEVGIHLKGRSDEATVRMFENPDARAVSADALRALRFSDSQIGSMDYRAEITRRRYKELEHYGIGLLPVVSTVFQAEKLVDAGLVVLRGGETITATKRCLLSGWKCQKVFDLDGFDIADKRQRGNVVIYSMVNP